MWFVFTPSSNLCLDVRNAAHALLSKLGDHPVPKAMPSLSKIPDRQVKHDIDGFLATVYQSSFDLVQVKPLFEAALADDVQDKTFWPQVAAAVCEYTPVPPPDSCQTPDVWEPGDFKVLAEYEEHLELVLQEEAGMFHTGALGSTSGSLRLCRACGKRQARFSSNARAATVMQCLERDGRNGQRTLSQGRCGDGSEKLFPSLQNWRRAWRSVSKSRNGRSRSLKRKYLTALTNIN